ncbi:MAG: class II aldolase/adducin family protein [Dehalococcoidia bacterium]|nr:class II aldolase/adducin family protein [Dehalococcoidia bacterium]
MDIPAPVMNSFQEVGRDLYQLGLVTSHGGNLSIRDGSAMWITGTGTMLGRLKERHIARVFADGAHAGPTPSSDTMLHTAVYALTGAGAVVHAHPRHAIALSFETTTFTPEDFEGKLHLQDVPVIEQGTAQLERVAGALQSRLVVLLRGHGAYARGATLWEALHWITALEESAQIAVIRRTLAAARPVEELDGAGIVGESVQSY